MSFWFDDINKKVYTWLKAELKEKIGLKYPDLYVTNEKTSDNYAKFPTVYISELEPLEKGRDLTNQTVNALDLSYQIEVTDNQSSARCKEVASECVGIMKDLYFNITNMPISTKDGNLFKSYMRCRRTIGMGEEL